MVLLGRVQRPQLQWGSLSFGLIESAANRTAGVALVAIRAFPDQQSLRITVLPGLGVHGTVVTDLKVYS